MLANNVPSERVFSSMNMIHTKARSSLGLEKVFKLIYIHFNLRALRETTPVVNDDGSKEEDLIAEDEFLQEQEQILGKCKYEESE